MPNVKITAMPSLGGNQVPTDLVTAVDLSAAPVNQNVKSTLNDLFATITKNITDRAIRFQAPGSAPAVAAANQGALYHNGTGFLASSNGGAYEPLYTLSAQSAALVFAGPTWGPAATPTFRALALTDLPAGIGTVTSVGLSAPSFLNVANSPVTGSGTLALSLATQSAALVFAGPTSGPAATPTFRALELTDLPQIATASLLGRISAGTGSPEQITSTAALLTWLTNPTSANLLSAMGDETGNGLLVFNQSPLLVTPNIATIRASNNQDVLNLIGQTGPGGRNFFQMTSGLLPNGPTLEAFNSTQADIDLIIRAKGNGSVRITGAAVQAIGPGTNPGIVEARGGNQLGGGGKIYLYERSNNGTNYVGFEAPDSIASDIFWTLPATDGTAGQVLSTNGAGILLWATRGTGTVTSVGLSAPSIFTVANSPVTGSGTLALSLAPQGQNTIFGGPITGGSGTPFFRFLQTADLPQLATSTILGRASAGFGTTESVAVSAGIWTWLRSATADNLRSAVVGDTGTGDLVFANAPTITSPTVSSGNLDFTGAGRRITGDGTSTGTAVFDRLGFMSQTANSNSVFICVPNGSGSISGLLFFDRGNDTSHFAQGQFLMGAGSFRFNTRATGSATALPLFFQTSDVTRLQIETNGNIGFNGNIYSNGVGVLHIGNATTTPTVFPTSGGILYVTASGALRWRGPSTDTQIAPA